MIQVNQVKKVLWLILLANVVVAVTKIVLGIIIGSSSVTADGFHSFTDMMSNVIGLIGIQIAAKPIDYDHPYGHRKYETLTGLFIVGMLLYMGIKITAEAIARFSNPTIPEITLPSIIIMLATLVLNSFVTKYESKKGKDLNSTILTSDALHTRSDIYVTIGVTSSIIAIRLGLPVWIDPVATLVVAGFIFHAAIEIFKLSCAILVDSTAVDMAKVEQIAMAQDGVKGVHKIRSRGSVDDMHIDMHILADACLSLEASHQLAHNIEIAFRKELNNEVDVFVHLEPYSEVVE